MRIALTLLILGLVSSGHASIKEDVGLYDDSVVSANDHYSNGKTAFEKLQIQDANAEYLNGLNAVRTADQRERDVRAISAGTSIPGHSRTS
jgi:hypothetical protein